MRPQKFAVLFLFLIAPFLSFSQCDTVLFHMYDSFGDGWTGATYSILDSLGDTTSTGTLSTGTTGTDTLCLDSGVYYVYVNAGTWAQEVSWEIEIDTVVANGLANDSAWFFVGPSFPINVGCKDPNAENYNPTAIWDDGSCSYPPLPNDSCHQAISIQCDSSYSFYTLTATADSTLPCNSTNRGGWYTYTASSSQLLTLSLCRNEVSPACVGIYTGNCDSLVCKKTVEIDGNCNSSPTQASFHPTPGVAYYFYLFYMPVSVNNSLNFSVSCSPIAESPNDSCTTAQHIACGDTITGSTAGTSLSSPSSTCSFTGNGLWYAYQGGGELVTVNFCHNYLFGNPKLRILQGECDSLVCNTDVSYSYSSKCPGNGSTSFYAVDGETYYLFVHDVNHENSGEFTLSLACTEVPANDYCAGAVEIKCDTGYLFSNSSATPDNNLPCNSGKTGIWIKVPGNGEQVTLRFGRSVCSKIGFTLFEGDCNNLYCRTTEILNDPCYTGQRTPYSFFAESGTDYYFMLYYLNSPNYQNTIPIGNISVSMECEPVVPASNDSCHKAMPMACGDTITGSLSGGGVFQENIPGCSYPSSYPGLWYRVVGTGDVFSLTVKEIASDNRIKVFTGSCDSLVCLDEDGNSGYLSSPIVTFLSQPGQEYFVFVTTTNMFTGGFTMVLHCFNSSPPPNDDCNTAIAIACDSTYSMNTVLATADPDAPCTWSHLGVWYSYMGMGNHLSIEACREVAGFACVRVFEGACDSLQCLSVNEINDCSFSGSTIALPSELGVEYKLFFFYMDLHPEPSGMTFTLNCLPDTSSIDGSLALNLSGESPCDSNFTPTFELTNTGDHLIDNATIRYGWDGNYNHSLVTNPNINTGATSIITAPALSVTGTQTFNAYLELVNGSQDDSSYNDTAKAVINTPNVPSVTYYPGPEICGGDGKIESVVTGGNPPFSYLWNDPLAQTTDVIYGLTSGWYSVSLTDANGCLFVDSVFVPHEPITIPTTQVKANQCGITVSSLWEYIYVYPVPGALRYQFEFTPTGGGASTLIYSSINNPSAGYFSLASIPGIAYGQTYSVRVRARVNGCWGDFGAACTVSAPPNIPVCVLNSSSCGVTLGSVNDNIYWNQVPGATRYQIIVSTGGVTLANPLSSINNPTLNYISLSTIPGISYNTTYHVCVRAQVGGTWGNYGPVCLVTTPALTEPTLVASHCNTTLNSIWDYVYITPISGAQRYAFRITNGGSYNTVVLSSYNNPTATWFYLGSAPGIQAFTTYNVEVAAKVAGNWGTYGPACALTTPLVFSKAPADFPTDHGFQTEPRVSLYPNPSHGDFNIAINDLGPSEENIFLQLFDNQGKLVYTASIAGNEEMVNHSMNLDLPKGMYFFRIQRGVWIKTEKVIIH